MGKKNIRLNNLMHMIKEKGTMRVTDLSEQLGVSLMTIRRDLDELQNNGLVERSYGKVSLSGPDSGALFENIENVYTLYGESEKMLEEKQRIGQFAASLIQPNEIVIFDNGSTTDQAANYIPNDYELTVASFNLNIAQKLHSLPNVKLLLAGGYFHHGDMMFESEQGVDFLKGIRANKVLLSASGIHEKLGLTCAHNYEVSVKRTIIRSALQTILLADSSKFGAIKTVFFAQLSEIDLIVTDSGLSQEWQDMIAAMGIELKIV